MDLPPHLHPFEALLPQEPGPARVDALLALSADPHPCRNRWRWPGRPARWPPA